MLIELKKELEKEADPKKAKSYAMFFKTGKGEYGEGDKFLGITVPIQRKTARKYKDLPLKDAVKLLTSSFHEYRLTALFILIYHFEKADGVVRKEIADIYLKNTKYINNWDLVDSSAPQILGAYLLDKDRSVLYKLAKSKDLWEKRIAMLSTYAFIKNKDFKDALKISSILLKDRHDLIHKAVGWMLREVGNRDQKAEIVFLEKHHEKMPKVMLRYAIEKFPKNLKDEFIKK